MQPVAPLVPLDRGSPVPLYFQVAGELQRLVRDGTLAPGARLENEIDLAERLGVSRPTVRRALQYLVDRGLLVRKRGVGTQVVGGRVERSLELTSLHDDLTAAGRTPTTAVLDVSYVPAEQDVAAVLGVVEGDAVLHVRRLRSADGEPIALMTNYLPVTVLDVTAAELEARGLYALLRAAGVNIRVADQSIGATTATAAQGRLLGEPRGAALLTMTRTAYDDVGRPVEHGRHVYRASRYAFSLTLVER